MKADLSRAKNAQFFSGRDDLFDSPDDLQVSLLSSTKDGDSSKKEWGRDQRGRLLDQNRRLDNATDRLDNTHQVGIETEELGLGTLELLTGQRNQLESADKGVRPLAFPSDLKPD